MEEMEMQLSSLYGYRDDTSDEQRIKETDPDTTISKHLSLPCPGFESPLKAQVEYPDNAAGKWCLRRPQVGIVSPDGSVVATGCLDDVVAEEGPDCPVLRQGGDRPVYSTAGYECMIADVAERSKQHKSGMTRMEEKVYREYPEAYDEIRDMVGDAGILSPEEELELVRKFKGIVEKWKNIYKDRTRRREEDLKKALGEKGYKNRKTTARRMGLGTKAYEEKTLEKIYAAETKALKEASQSALVPVPAA
jgi:hypothetical protein